jgi:hypothetical protein
MFLRLKSIGAIRFLPIFKLHHRLLEQAAFLSCEFSGNRAWRSAISVRLRLWHGSEAPLRDLFSFVFAADYADTRIEGQKNG